MPNAAAQALAKKRWAGTSPEERSAEMSRIARLGSAALTPEERSARAKLAGSAPKKARKKRHKPAKTP